MSARLLTETVTPDALMALLAASLAVEALPSYVQGMTCEAGPTLTSFTSLARSSSRGLALRPRGDGFFLRSSKLSGLPTLMVVYLANSMPPLVERGA